MMNTRPAIFGFFVLMILLSGTLFAQQFPLRLLKSNNGFYLEHKVSPKQGLYSIGRLYSVHPNYLASYNNLDSKKGLQIDQLIRIPLSDSNFGRKHAEGVPVYLTAATDDDISDLAKFVGVEVRLLQCWNQQTGVVIKKGSRWIIGFLITPEMTGQQLKFSCKPKEVTVPIEPQATPPPQPIQPPQPVQPSPSTSSISFFESAFLEQVQKNPTSQDLKVFSSVFKTKSGWSDGKHYVLIDNLVPGTIVKLINPMNRQAIYAKVLGEMPRIKQNEGLDIRISDAAVEKLGLTGTERFPLQLIY
jgi:LysM repeat protein